MNSLGREGKPFAFIVDFAVKKPVIFEMSVPQTELQWQTPRFSHFAPQKTEAQLRKWKTTPVNFEKYHQGFKRIQKHIHQGDSYLLNYTQPTLVETNLSLTELFHLSSAPYKILLQNQFVCFSPESFVSIRDGKIASFPMKGTIDAGNPDARKTILRDAKEQAEHSTIVDLIRNDLSMHAHNVTVEKFRYLERIRTSHRDLWQVSSKITGNLPGGYAGKIGDILFSMLPAGSVSGAPKKKTVEIIQKAEGYDRGYYTGIFGVFDGKDLDSCVLIRYVENQNGKMVYKSGGGITFMSIAENEYEEMLKKVYVPIA